ncbi:hypothetical protein ACLBV4_32050, partial [Pseudomonas aeruginosa]|uniref:hypothetical protein n=1 Tax=Pseudomonas aeruginosa TaxID=287 RepID=UPI00396953E2
MHLTPHWIPLVASLGLLASGLSASAAEEAFDLWNECAKAWAASVALSSWGKS